MQTIFQLRKASSSVTDFVAKQQPITSTLFLTPGAETTTSPADRPLVLLYGWLGAKAKHIHKFSNFYAGLGYDVLRVKMEASQLLFLKRSQKICSDILDFASQPAREQQPILVHGFSVGGYLYSETLNKVLSGHDQRYYLVGKRIRGHIFDSPVDADGIAHGTSRAVTEVAALQKIIEMSLALQLRYLRRSSLEHYWKMSAIFHGNPLASPSLMLYSKSDQIALVGPIERAMKQWREKGVPVTSHCWADSKHVSHYHKYPDEYLEHVILFLRSIGLLADADSGSVRGKAKMDLKI